MKEREFEPNSVTELEVLRLKLTENGGVNRRVDGSWRGVKVRDFMVTENCWDLESYTTRLYNLDYYLKFPSVWMLIFNNQNTRKFTKIK